MIVTINDEKLQVQWIHDSTTLLLNGEDTKLPRTQCLIKNGDEKVLVKSESLCGPTDNYCRNTGRKISLTRAIEDFPKSQRAEYWKTYFAMRHGKR